MDKIKVPLRKEKKKKVPLIGEKKAGRPKLSEEEILRRELEKQTKAKTKIQTKPQPKDEPKRKRGRPKNKIEKKELAIMFNEEIYNKLIKISEEKKLNPSATIREIIKECNIDEIEERLLPEKEVKAKKEKIYKPINVNVKTTEELYNKINKMAKIQNSSVTDILFNLINDYEYSEINKREIVKWGDAQEFKIVKGLKTQLYENKNKQLGLHLTERTYEKLNEDVSKLGITRSDFICYLIDRIPNADELLDEEQTLLQ